VPALVHGDKCVGGSEAICRYADKTFSGNSLVPAAAAATVDKFVKLVADVAHEDLVSGYFLKTGHPGARGAALPARARARARTLPWRHSRPFRPTLFGAVCCDRRSRAPPPPPPLSRRTVAKVVLPQVAEGTLARLNSLAASTESDTVKAAVAIKVTAASDKLAKMADPVSMFDKANAQFTTLLDALDKALDRPAPEGEGKAAHVSGDEFTLADVYVSCLLARAHWAAEPRDALLARPRVASYWAHVSKRKAFDKADVWTGLKPGAALALLGEAAVDSVRAVYDIAAREWSDKVAPPLGHAWHAVADPVANAACVAGGAINDHVVRPVTDSVPFKAASLAVKAGAHATGEWVNDKVVTPCKEGGNATAGFFSHAAESTMHAAEAAAEATKHAAQAAADATKHAAEAAAEATKHAAERVKEAASPKHASEEDEKKKKEEEDKKAEDEKKKKEEEAK
jgi:glutathione S-transferase